MKKVGILVGSLRKDSWSLKVAKAFMELDDTREYELMDISQLEMYNQEYDEDIENLPVSYQVFREKVTEKDAYIFITPEHNRSIPAVLKNAIDAASVPFGNSEWSHKPALIISVSPGSLGGFGANHHLRQILTSMNCYVMAQPEVYIGRIYQYVDENGDFKEDTMQFFAKILNSFNEWIDQTTEPYIAEKK